MKKRLGPGIVFGLTVTLDSGTDEDDDDGDDD